MSETCCFAGVTVLNQKTLVLQSRANRDLIYVAICSENVT